ncbi:MAG: prepilin-type N-terminal cleavage/methylation domain-containing protein [Verrucomicrobia bacterium]|nr:prepilin-type N-terminal cleavage/methylation domain-containing protein [Verrucomicrobiota bacterium]
MKTKQIKSRAGFTLIEMIGVIAIIAILAAVLVPKVMNAIARSKVSGTSLVFNALKTAVADYYSRSNSFPLRSGTGAADTATPTGRFDADLVAAGFIDKLVGVPIGSTATTGALTTRTHVRVLAAVAAAAVNPTAAAGGDNFDLDSNAATADFTAGQNVVSLMIPQVAIADAIVLNSIIDGVVNSGTAADRVGRCIYSAAAAGTVTVYIYLAHQ